MICLQWQAIPTGCIPKKRHINPMMHWIMTAGIQHFECWPHHTYIYDFPRMQQNPPWWSVTQKAKIWCLSHTSTLVAMVTVSAMLWAFPGSSIAWRILRRGSRGTVGLPFLWDVCKEQNSCKQPQISAWKFVMEICTSRLPTTTIISVRDYWMLPACLGLTLLSELTNHMSFMLKEFSGMLTCGKTQFSQS